MESECTKSRNRLPEKTIKNNLQSRTYLSENSHNSKEFKLAGKSDTNMCTKSVEMSLKVTKHKHHFKENQKNSEILVTDALKKIQKKTLPSCKEKSNCGEVSSCSTAAQGSVVIDKQLATVAPFKKIKCIYTILNNGQINTLRKHAQEAVKRNKIFTIRGNYNSVRHALKARGWVEKLETGRKQAPFASGQISICDLSQIMPKRKLGETDRQFIAKVERSIMARYIENAMCDFLWTPHKEKADHIEQSRNTNMLINKFSRAPFTNKENLNAFLRDIAAFYDEGLVDIRFPRCYNVWSLEELAEFVDNYKLTACIAFVQWLVDKYRDGGFDAVFSPGGKIPFTSIDFALERCLDYMEFCEHNDIDTEDPPRIWETDWDAFLHQHHQITHDGLKILADPQKLVEPVIVRGSNVLQNIRHYWPQQAIDGYQNLWIIKPANKCRGRGILLSNNLKKIINFVNPSMAAKSRFVVQKYIERPLTIHQTKFDIRQWFLISSIHPLMIWMYRECYLRFSSQQYTLTNHHESVHLTNHAIQKKYTNNGKRDKRLPSENMWDSYSFQAYLRQIGKQEYWLERIYPGMRQAIVAAVLVSQDHMERTANTFELFGADFMVCENLYPWLIEINSNPDLASSTSVTARMCPQCLEDVIKVMIDRRSDAKADVGNFELIYRQTIPPAPAYMGLNLVIKGKQIPGRSNGSQRKEKSLPSSHFSRHRNCLGAANATQVCRAMPSFNATDYIEKCLNDEVDIASPLNKSIVSISSHPSLTTDLSSKRRKSIHTFMGSVAGPSRTKISSSNFPHSSAAYASRKRHRSCGARLSTNFLMECNEASSQQAKKFLVSSCNQQKALYSSRNLGFSKTANMLATPLLAISKSADNIRELKSPLKNIKSQSSVTPMKENPSCCKTAAKLHKEEGDVATIHAIGKSLGSWNINKRKP